VCLSNHVSLESTHHPSTLYIPHYPLPSPLAMFPDQYHFFVSMICSLRRTESQALIRHRSGLQVVAGTGVRAQGDCRYLVDAALPRVAHDATTSVHLHDLSV
jgi:hypothetical protein